MSQALNTETSLESVAGDMSLDRSAIHDINAPIAAIASSYLPMVSSIAAVLITGFAFSFLPYLRWWHSTGHFVYIADLDSQYYLQLASRMYYGNLLSVRDVVLLHSISPYQSLEFAPAVIVTHMLGLSVLQVNAIWHLWTAIAMPLAFYVVFFHWLRRPWAAAFCAIVMLVDCGVLTVEPLIIPLMRLYQAALGHLPVLYDGDSLLGQWRMVNPAIGMPLLLLQIFLVSSAVERRQDGKQDRRLVAAAGISTGVLFYTWFYYWPAAIGALTISLILDRPTRRVYALILAIGVVVGLPAIVDGFTTKALLNSDALSRIGFFAPVPRLSFLLLPKAALLALLVTGIWIWRKPNREGLYLWCLALSALLLSNNHIVSGMDLRAGHWRFVWGASLSILALAMVVQFFQQSFRVSRWAIAMVAVSVLLVELTAGIILRAIEGASSVNQQLVLNKYKKLELQGRKGRELLPLNAVVAGDEAFCDMASIVSGVRPLAGYAAFLSLEIDNREWAAREALNAHLQGLSEQEFRSKAHEAGTRYGWGESADKQAADRIESTMMREFAATSDPRSALNKFDVSYVAIPTARPDPDYLKPGWTLIEAGPSWRIFQKN